MPYSTAVELITMMTVCPLALYPLLTPFFSSICSLACTVLFCSPGIAALHAAHPEVFIVAGEIDTGLNQMVGQFVTCSIIILLVKKYAFSQLHFPFLLLCAPEFFQLTLSSPSSPSLLSYLLFLMIESVELYHTWPWRLR